MTENPYAIPVEDLVDSARVPVTAQVVEQPERRFSAAVPGPLPGPTGCRRRGRRVTRAERPGDDGWDDLLVQLSPEVAALVDAADELIRRTDPAVVRVVWPHQKTVGYGVGPKKMSEHYAYLAVHPRHVNLGCNYGAHLDDGGLLEGTGQNMRKMTVRTVDDLADPRLVPLLRTGAGGAAAALGRS